MCRITQETRGYTFNTREKRMDRCPIKGEFVQCKDCTHRGTIYCDLDYCGYRKADNWYCADGEREDDEII